MVGFHGFLWVSWVSGGVALLVVICVVVFGKFGFLAVVVLGLLVVLEWMFLVGSGCGLCQ